MSNSTGLRPEKDEEESSQMTSKEDLGEPMTDWARHPLEFDEDQLFNALETGLTVKLIATSEPGLVTCDVHDKLIPVVTETGVQTFDYLPVKRDGHIVGLLNRAKIAQTLDGDEHCQLPDTVGEKCKPLDDSMLIASNAGILTFIETADSSPCRLVLTGHQVDGIVTISDLHRLPVRPVLFLLVTHLELLMARVIRDHYKDNEPWLSCLGNRREKLENDWNKFNEENLAIDILTASQFCDKREVIVKLFDLGMSKTEARRQLGVIEKLRDAVVHGSEYAQTADAALETICRVKLARTWIKKLSGLTKKFRHLREDFIFGSSV